MPYVRKGKCVYKATGEKVGCSATEAKAKAHLRALYANTKETMQTPKEFALAFETTEKDFDYAQAETWVVDSASQALSYLMNVARQEMYMQESSDSRTIARLMKDLITFMGGQVDEMLDALTDTVLTSYKESGFTSTKEENGSYRWVVWSSSAFEDKDEEIVSEKALSDDCDRMEATGDYGELLWWHCDGDVHPERGEKDARPYLPLGKCDISFVSDKINIESGTYYDNAVGALFESNSKEYGVSKQFWHKPGEPVDGVFTWIKSKERSLLPRSKEANFLTRLFTGNREKEMAKNDERLAALKLAVGEEKAQEILAQAKEASEKADAILKSKEAKAEDKTETKDEVQVEDTKTDDSATKELKDLLVAMKESQEKSVTDLTASLTEFKESQVKELTALREDWAGTQKLVDALMGFTPKGEKSKFVASKDGKTVALTDDQKKAEKEALGSRDGFEGITDWLITGDRSNAAAA